MTHIDYKLAQILKVYKELNKAVPVCSYDDCRKVNINNIWLKAPYNPEYDNYSHGVCPECEHRMYEKRKK